MNKSAVIAQSAAMNTMYHIRLLVRIRLFASLFDTERCYFSNIFSTLVLFFWMVPPSQALSRFSFSISIQCRLCRSRIDWEASFDC